MANWTDGPEYAPLERPEAFAAPVAEPLETPPPAPHPASGAPPEQPDYQPPAAPVTPLEALVPGTGPTRDPQQAFAVTTAAMTAGVSAWGAAHSVPGAPSIPGGAVAPAWTPEQPLATSAVPALSSGQAFPPPHQQATPFPQPGTPDWFAPPPQARWAPPTPQQVTLPQVWRATTPGVVIPLLIGAVLSPLSVVMFGLAFALTTRVKYRRQQVRKVFGGTAGLLLVIGAFGLINPDQDLETWWTMLSTWAQVFCWVLPVVVLVLVGAGIRAGEQPERPY